MFNEIWLWVKEKLSSMLSRLWLLVKKLWLSFFLFIRGLSGTTWRRIALFVPLFFFLYILIGIAFVHRIDDSLSLNIKAEGSRSLTVETVAWLADRETRKNRWTPNDPAFLPGWWIDNTPSYQTGIINALSRFSMELRDQIGRSRGSSSVDPDLQSIAGNLAIEGDRWIMDFDTSFLPTTPSEKFYSNAVDQLRDYNNRVANGQAIFEKRTDNLLATLDRIALDLGDASASIDNYIMEEAGGFLPDTGADNLFYTIKGKSYAYTLILKALKEDFSKVITDKDLDNIYQNLTQSMEAIIDLDPLIVTNGKRDGILSNHLAQQGFSLLRARTQLKEITNILLK